MAYNLGKCVVVGDSGVGKTCMAIVYDKKVFPTDYVPTIYSAYIAYVKIDSEGYEFVLWDTTGNSEYDRLRRNCDYHSTNVVFLCFSVTQPTSFVSVMTRWYPELQEICPDVPVIVIGTKTDLRNDEATINELRESGLSPITKDEGQQLAKDINAVKYLECSSMTNEGVSEVGLTIVQTILSGKSADKGKKDCVLQ